MSTHQPKTSWRGCFLPNWNRDSWPVITQEKCCHYWNRKCFIETDKWRFKHSFRTIVYFSLALTLKMLFLPYMDVFFLKHTWYSNQPVFHGSCLLAFVCVLTFMTANSTHPSKSSLKSPLLETSYVFLSLGELFFAISLIPLILSLHLFSNCFGSQSNLPKYVASSLKTLP